MNVSMCAKLHVEQIHLQFILIRVSWGNLSTQSIWASPKILIQLIFFLKYSCIINKKNQFFHILVKINTEYICETGI